MLPLSGILNINKPAGMTSHDVVDRVRRITGVRRVGHAGTLDPLATGVLLVCVGQATRVAEYLMASDKRYRATIHLGVRTSTDDAEGEVLSSQEVQVSEGEVQAVLQEFVGRIQQVPPMYSALKRGGKRLYQLARQGITVERPPRPVTIHRIEWVKWDPPRFTIDVTCSPGTYIRALARDIGERLGCGAHLAALVRLASGHFTLDEAVTLEQVAEAFAAGRGEELLLPLDEALRDWPAVTVDAETARRIGHGQAVALPMSSEGRCRAYGPDGQLLALLEYNGQKGLWQPRKVFRGARS